MTEVFGLGTRPCVHMGTRLENGVLHNGRQLGSAVNSLIKLKLCRTVGPFLDKAVLNG